MVRATEGWGKMHVTRSLPSTLVFGRVFAVSLAVSAPSILKDSAPTARMLAAAPSFRLGSRSDPGVATSSRAAIPWTATTQPDYPTAPHARRVPSRAPLATSSSRSSNVRLA